MKLKEKLRLMEEIEKRNQSRIKVFACKPRKYHSRDFREKAEGNRDTPKKSK